MPLVNYFNPDLNSRSADVWKAIHVDTSTKSPVWELENDGVDLALIEHRLIDYSSNYTALFNANSPVLIYAGEFDEDSGPITQEVWLRTLDIPDKEAFWGQARSIYKVYDEEHKTYVTGGYYRQNDVFNFLTVPRAGQHVPNLLNNYQTTLAFLSDMINNNGKLMCPEAAAPCSVAENQISAMNNCTYPQGTGN